MAAGPWMTHPLFIRRTNARFALFQKAPLQAQYTAHILQACIVIIQPLRLFAAPNG